MTREEIITKVQNLINQAYKYDIDSEYYEGLFDEIENLRQPPTLAEFLGWEEGIEYRRGGSYFKIEGNHLLQKGHSGKWVNMNLQTWELIDLRQATKVEEKLKAYHVKDEYSYNELMKELEEQGYMFDVDSYGRKKPTKLSYYPAYGTRDYIYLVGDKEISWSSNFNTSTPHIYDGEVYDLIEYHKEPKPKAYHVKDEYSYDCLMKELEEQGYMWGFYKKATELDAWRDYEEEIIIYCTNEKKLRFSDLAYYKDKEKDDYDLVEYHKEEPKFYARYKGSINLYQDYNYYNYLAWKGVCVISDKGEVFDSIIQMTKSEWNELGINDTNADFEEVE